MNIMTLAMSVTRNEPAYVDAQHSAQTLKIEAKARRDAQRGELATTAGPTPAEQEIEHYHQSLRHQRIEQLTTRLDAEQARQMDARLDFEQPAFDATVQELEHEALAQKAEFAVAATDLQREQARRQRDYNAFCSAARLTRQPIEPPSLALHWAVLVAFVVVESLANAPFFAAGNILGLAGGLSVALCVAALNVLVGACVGGSPLRCVNHVRRSIKVFGCAVGCAYGAFLLAFHLGVGHWRNALAGLIPNGGPADAGRAALDALIESPWSLITLESWGLVLIGVLFGLLAVAAGYRAADPYPGHSAAAARLRAAASELRRHKDGYLAGLNAIFEGDPRRGGRPGADARLNEIRQHALRAMAAFRASAAETARLMQQQRAVLSQVEASRVVCLSRYRSIYTAVRGSAPPHDAVSGRPPARAEAQVPDLARYTPAPIDEPALHAALAAKLAAATSRARAAQREHLDGAAAMFAELGLERAAPCIADPSPARQPASEAVESAAAAQVVRANGRPIFVRRSVRP